VGASPLRHRGRRERRNAHTISDRVRGPQRTKVRLSIRVVPVANGGLISA